MKKKIFLSLFIGMMFSLTSCQFIDQAIEDTFRKDPEKLIKDEEINKDLLEKTKEALFDESNNKIFVLEIISDAEDKMGFEFPIKLNSYFQEYLYENYIHRYLSKQEIENILKAYKDDNLLLNNDLLKDLIKDLAHTVGANDFYLYEADIKVYDTSLYAYVIDPKNPEHVDLYYYNLGIGDWHIRPEKIETGIDPKDNSILLSEINVDAYKKIVQTGTEILKEMDDYKETYLWDNNFGISYIYTQYKGEDLVFRATVKGTREDYNLTFDANGNLIEKERK